MKPRRHIFAKEYIEETVAVYKEALLANSDKANSNIELKWAHDVLSQYFSVVGAEPKIDKARLSFLSLPSLPKSPKFVPYIRNLEEPSAVSFEQFLSLSYQRRSVRWYLQKPVPRELLDKAIIAASYAPSACNRQPFEFRVFDDPSLVQRVAEIPMGTKGFSHNFPVIIVVLGMLRAYFDERDRHLIYIDAALASMSLMYAFETLGLSSCPINWPDIEVKEQKISRLLNLKSDERAIMLISVGYPSPEGMVAYSQKKILDEIRRYN
ncbi:MAG: nitroreductase family protein [Cyanobacteria bacterium P01_D01_bin.14]